MPVSALVQQRPLGAPRPATAATSSGLAHAHLRGHAHAATPGLANGGLPAAAAAAQPPPGRRAVAARAATGMRNLNLPNLAGGLTSLRDISIDMSDEDMQALELRNVQVRAGACG